MTATAVRPPQLSFPGQAAAPDGPVDLAGMYLMHRGFRRDLHAFAEAAAATPVGDRTRWVRLARRFGLFASILHKHHHGEDIGLWPLLAERGADPDTLADLALLTAGTDTTAARDRLAGSCVRLRDELGAHLAHEERDGMALVQAHLTQADWDRLDREVFAKDYAAREVPAVLGWVVSGLPEEGLRRMPGGGNALFRAFGRWTARRFERREARIFGVRTS